MCDRVLGAVATVALAAAAAAAGAAPQPQPPHSAGTGQRPTSHSRQVLNEYFRRLTDRIARQALADVDSLDDWRRMRPRLRRQLLDMLGLWPLPERTDLKPVVTGTVDGGDIVVEKLHFQSRPGLYVTANFYRPKQVNKPLPTILYLCGHGRVEIDGVSYGNKVHYQHHPTWFARHGYCCLILDSLQLGEIEGIHHGTYRYGMWWWNARGYTPAGVEAWNCVRALDYLQTRPEVDAKRIGVTGRSGGGIYTWWLAAIDDRPACLVPVAGITDLKNYVVDGAIEGHCDCMFMINTYRWDFPMVAALAAPRPLLLSNSDKDRIFPLDGVLRTHAALRRIYKLYGAADKLGLLITEGPHRDTQELRIPAFRWFNRWLRATQEPITETGEQPFEPQQLKVFDTLPSDQRNTAIHESFVARASFNTPPATRSEWEALRRRLTAELEQKVFGAWPRPPEPLEVKEAGEAQADGIWLRVLQFRSEENLRLPVYVLGKAGARGPAKLTAVVVDDRSWVRWRTMVPPPLAELLPAATAADRKQGRDSQGQTTGGQEAGNFERDLLERLGRAGRAIALLPPRGVGPNQWDTGLRRATHIRRRFVLLGCTADSGRVWDVRRALAALRTVPELKQAALSLTGTGQAAGIALYAGLFEPQVQRFELRRLPVSHRAGPIFINVLRVLDMPQAVALAFPRPVVLSETDPAAWQWPAAVAKLYGPATLRLSSQ